jgi:opacity protein-like surface antigen
MRMLKSVSFLVAMLVALPAFAQQRPATPAPDPLRGYLVLGGGSSINTAQNSLMINAEIAENVIPDIQVYLGAAYFDNVMSQGTRDQLAQTGATLTALTGTPWVFEGRDRARSFTLGARYLVPTSGSIRPYVGGGVGAINFRRTIREQSRGNITEAYLTQFGSADGVVDSTQSNTTRPMTELAIGVSAAVKKAYIDVGYRWRKAFHTLDDTFEISGVGAAVGLKF